MTYQYNINEANYETLKTAHNAHNAVYTLSEMQRDTNP